MPEIASHRIPTHQATAPNSGGNVLSANFFHVFLRAAPLLTADRFAPHRREQSEAMLGANFSEFGMRNSVPQHGL
jgi:hypothetical protein